MGKKDNIKSFKKEQKGGHSSNSTSRFKNKSEKKVLNNGRVRVNVHKATPKMHRRKPGNGNQNRNQKPSQPKTLKYSEKINRLTKDKDQKRKVNIKDEEDQIYLIENENNLFKDEHGFYSIKKEEELVNAKEDEWEDNEDDLKMVNLHELLSSKMNQHEDANFDKKTIEGFKDLGEILNKWTSGKLPKLFGVLPSIEQWKDLIDYTKPFSWTPHSMYEGTCMFASNLNNTLVEDFYKLYLVPYIRNNIRKFGKLNIHLYNALKKSIYKPAGFFKGIIFPIAENLTSKEANIIGSILSKCSIPIIHSSSAIVRLTELNGYDRISHGHFFFIKLLLSKKYALPTPVKSCLVEFLGKIADKVNKGGVLPVIYHQVLLVFTQTYKFDLNDQEKAILKKVCNSYTHHVISELVLKELNYKK